MVLADNCAACLGSHQVTGGHMVPEEIQNEINRILSVVEPLRGGVHKWG